MLQRVYLPNFSTNRTSKDPVDPILISSNHDRTAARNKSHRSRPTVLPHGTVKTLSGSPHCCLHHQAILFGSMHFIPPVSVIQWKSFVQMVQISDGQIAALAIEKVSMNAFLSISWTVTGNFRRIYRADEQSCSVIRGQEDATFLDAVATLRAFEIINAPKSFRHFGRMPDRILLYRDEQTNKQTCVSVPDHHEDRGSMISVVSPDNIYASIDLGGRNNDTSL
ncbi:hypothetical protein IW261DRAFT_350038 [Armillaria novae-zelandiae]|uniref:Uncharacterized protein n=1 Tax=Armillaria novae-zelandiae TaxID=153914 RepID=A0AA39PQ26_9AGAR|nr:hypothetical protein IW261DRAFT_350038 [Armillaria novae-zelandiae]